MTIQELITWALDNHVDLDTHIALRAKDDYLLVENAISFDVPYFGNCRHGDKLIDELTPLNVDGDIDYDQAPKFLILDTGRD